MFEVTASARQELKTFFIDKGIQPLRIFLKTNTCGGPRLVVGIDEQRDGDRVFEIDGLTYVIEHGFFEEIKPLTVDFSNNNFTVSAAVSFGEGCSGCDITGCST
jgi:Fe-S cluster assembly iron-binding protein IscA